MTVNVDYGFFVVHPRRSGSHAIIRWLMGHGTPSFLANTSVPGSHRIGEWRYAPKAWLLDDPIGAKKDGLIYCEAPFPLKDPRAEADVYCLTSDKSVSIYCVENPPIVEVSSGWDTMYGEPRKHRHTILVLRSFWNTMASKLESAVYAKTRANPGRVGAAYRPADVDIWCEYARQAFKWIDHQSTILPIFFDQWFEMPEYRRQLEEILGLPRSDEGLNAVPYFGRGSSFDLRTFQGRGQEMDVLNRWKRIKDWPREILEAKEAHELDIDLFGDYRHD